MGIHTMADDEYDINIAPLHPLDQGANADILLGPPLPLPQQAPQNESHSDPYSPRVLARRFAIKVIEAPSNGWTRSMAPHHALRELECLRLARSPNVVRLLHYAFKEEKREHIFVLPLLSYKLTSLLAKLGEIHSIGFDKQLPSTPSEDIRVPAPIEEGVTDHSTNTTEDRANAALAGPSHPSHQSPPAIAAGLFTRTAKGVLSGLAYLHSIGIAHRDIKPDNVVFDWDGTPVLVDFGTAWLDETRLEDGATKGMGDDATGGMSCSVGTGPYRAPELLFSPATYSGPAIDLWSAGVMLAEFFHIGPSFDGDNDAGPDSPDSDSSDDEHLGDTEDELESEVPSLECNVASASLQLTPLFNAGFGELGLASSIFSLLGTPTNETWPTFTSLPDATKINFNPKPCHPLTVACPALSPGSPLDTASRGICPAILNLLSGLIRLEPSRRLHAEDAIRILRHPGFAILETSEGVRTVHNEVAEGAIRRIARLDALEPELEW